MISRQTIFAPTHAVEERNQETGNRCAPGAIAAWERNRRSESRIEPDKRDRVYFARVRACQYTSCCTFLAWNCERTGTHLWVSIIAWHFLSNSARKGSQGDTLPSRSRAQGQGDTLPN